MPPTTHPDRQALLRAVLARPDDDLPRLIMADALDEYGESEYAAFIRLQCELARPPRYAKDACWCAVSARSGCPYCDEQVETEALRRRERELLRENYNAWAFEVLRVFGVRREAPMALDSRLDHESFRRGFVEQITLPWEQWRCHAAALLSACPIRQRNAGTEEAPVWVERTGGKVVLTTRPEWRFYGPPIDRTVRLRDGTKALGVPDDTAVREDAYHVITRDLLAVEYPGVEFELPRPLYTLPNGIGVMPDGYLFSYDPREFPARPLIGDPGSSGRSRSAF
jgi:uncharacterized protein (TIGR02996 family)